MRTKRDLDNESAMRVLQTRCRQRGHALVIDGHGGTKTLLALDAVLPDLVVMTPPLEKPSLAAVTGGRTKRTLENLASLNRKARAKLEPFLLAAEELLAAEGVTVEVISGLRSWAQQSALYAQGRTKPGRIVTNAPAGSSWHNYGLAIDLGLFKGGRYLDEASPATAAKLYAKLGSLAAALGIEWAGTWKSFPEGPHFQWTAGLSLAEAKRRMEANGYDHQKILQEAAA
jgi:peptidoglycan L-alanyl-D-glutamate endopeptidase CwlK